MAETSSTTSATPETGSYAIVEASGQQFWLQANRYYDLDRLNAEVDATVTLDNVLLVKDSRGTTLGKPYVKDASVELKVMAHRRGPKVIVYKMRPKKEDPSQEWSSSGADQSHGSVDFRQWQSHQLIIQIHLNERSPLQNPPHGS